MPDKLEKVSNIHNRQYSKKTLNNPFKYVIKVNKTFKCLKFKQQEYLKDNSTTLKNIFQTN